MSNVLIFLLFLTPTIQYRVELGPFSFALMEPFVLLVSAMLLAHQIVSRRRLVILKNPLVYLFIGMTLWAFVVRPWATDWKHGLSDVRDWAIPVLGFVVLVSTVRSGWRRKTQMLMIIAILQSTIAIYQSLTDSFRVFVKGGSALYKTGFFASPGGSLPLASYGLGFFSHPNGFGYFASIGLLIWLGLYASSRRRLNILLLLSGIVLASALVLSYAKTSILAFVISALLMRLLRYRELHRLMPLAPVLGFLISFLAFLSGPLASIRYVPPEFATSAWRLELWQDSLDLVARNPTILLVGNGDSALWSLRSIKFLHPHNLPLYFLIYYGLPGVAWLTIYTVVLSRIGSIRISYLKRVPLLAALYLSLSTLLLTGIFEVMLNDINSRMIILLICSCFVGLERETISSAKGV